MVIQADILCFHLSLFPFFSIMDLNGTEDYGTEALKQTTEVDVGAS